MKKPLSVEAKVRHVVEHLWRPNADYMFHNWAQANVALAEIKRPVILYVMPANGELIPQWNQTIDKPTVPIAFLANVGSDVPSEENDRLMQSLKVLASQFIHEMNKSKLFERIPDNVPISYRAEPFLLDIGCIGIIMEFEIREVEGIKHCNP